MYSMKFKQLPNNPRILFNIEGNNISILLCIFEELGKKRTPKNSYQKHIDLAENRLKEYNNKKGE